MALSALKKKSIMQQSQALALLKMGKNVFLTGEAGSGKTYLLNQYIRYLKENKVDVAVTASTGIAATHLQGSTIHAWSGMGVKDTLGDRELEKLVGDARIKRNYKKTKVLIIDEISMLHPHQLDLVDRIARAMLEDKPFGGMQVVLCGDFFQLPPVTSGKLTSDKKFAFESAAWEQGEFQVCYLSEQHRQQNDPLHQVLNDIRSGNAGEHTKVPLRTRYKKEPEGGMRATLLYSRNMNVDFINERELASLSGDEKLFQMETRGHHSLVEGLKKSCLALEILRLKIGAEVMFIKNDVQGRYVNGTRCVVVGFERRDGWPVVKTYDGHSIVALPEEWKYEDHGSIRAAISQIPLRLAWAITIHKSQGMTLDAVEVDLGDAFEPGMGYVALSRVRRLSGLKLMNLNEMALKVHPHILERDPLFKSHSVLAEKAFSELSQLEIDLQVAETLNDRFEANRVKPVSKRGRKGSTKDKIPTHLQTLALLKENQSLQDIVKTRELTLGTVISHLEKLKDLQLIDLKDYPTLNTVLPEKDFNTILSAFGLTADASVREIYDQFRGVYAYASVAFVRLYV
jgi:ATP-dependent DNA helicase PIF1